MKRFKTLFLILIAISAIIATTLIIRQIQHKKTISSQEMVPVRLGSVPAITEVLTHTAYEEGFFAEQGLDVTMVINPDGKTNLMQVLNGDLDIGSTMSTPVIYQALERDDFQIFAKVHFSQPIHQGIGRKDSGITDDPQSIIGKKIATLLSTSAHYHFDSWLLYNGIDHSQLEIIDMSPPDGLAALIAGEIDAMFYWFPYNEMASQELGENAITFAVGDLVPSSWVYVAKNEYIQQHPEVIESFLKAMIQAQELYKKEKELAFKHYAKYSGLDESITAAFFSEMNYSIGLDQALLFDLEYQAEWINLNEYANILEAPNFLDYIYVDALEIVNPSAMTIIVGN